MASAFERAGDGEHEQQDDDADDDEVTGPEGEEVVEHGDSEQRADHEYATADGVQQRSARIFFVLQPPVGVSAQEAERERPEQDQRRGEQQRPPAVSGREDSDGREEEAGSEAGEDDPERAGDRLRMAEAGHDQAEPEIEQRGAEEAPSLGPVRH